MTPISSGPPTHAPISIVIAPSTGLPNLRLRELWEYRDLLYFLTWRDVKVRYKQTVLGATWAIIQPLFTMVIFTIFFGRLAKIPSDGVPYPLFAFAALAPWQLFAFSLNESATSLVTNKQLITKVYFPRLLVPMSASLAGLVDFMISLVFLVILMTWFGRVPGVRILLLPCFVLLAVISALAVGLWLGALNVKYRDVRYTLGFLVQLWLFASPVAYPTSIVPEKWKMVYGLNPMVGVIEGFRWVFFGNSTFDPRLVVLSSIMVVLLFISGMYYFRKVESTFADLV